MTGDVRCFPKLFQPGEISGIRIRNRIVMLPMGGYFPDFSSAVTDRSIAYYADRAKGGAGLIIVGVTRVTPLAEPAHIPLFNLSDDKLLPGHYHLVEAVHSYGAKIGIQLYHGGSQVPMAAYGGRQPPSPSGIQQFDVSGQPLSLPRPMNRGEIYQMIYYFAAAGTRAKRAGYDLVEIHGAHGYLVGSFMSPATNKRTDEFGGSLENRMRFAVEIIKEIHRLTGDNYPVGVRIDADEFIPGGITTRESPAMAKILEEAGAAYINISSGTYASQHKMNDVMRSEEGWKIPQWLAIKEAVTIPTIAGGGNRTPEFCERLIAEGKADFVGLARQMLADPYWPQKARQGNMEDINKCISCLRCLYQLGGGQQVVRHCAVNPLYGREKEFVDSKPATLPKKVMVIGGGVAGMEAAIIASIRGHEVTLYERQEELGGQLLLAAVPPGKRKMLWFRDYLTTQTKKHNVKVELGCEVHADTVERAKSDVLILATGAKPLVPDIPGIQDTTVVTAWDVLASKMNLTSQSVVILGGGMVGSETAEFLAKQGNRVTIVEMLPSIAQDMEPINRRSLLDELKECGVTILTGQKVVEVTSKGVVTVSMVSAERQSIEADQVVIALGSDPVRSLADEIESKVAELYLIGDCQRPRTILEAIYDGFIIGHRI